MDLDPVDIRTRLIDEAGRLRAEIDEEAVEQLEPMTYGSQAAAASQVFDQNRTTALRERAIRDLHAVEAALIRLDSGTYGRCQACGKPIAPERLEALPWAAYDVECQRRARP
jgi:RNA polymerase-binding transcription factor DksA